jgi:hypothetical protein
MLDHSHWMRGSLILVVDAGEDDRRRDLSLFF